MTSYLFFKFDFVIISLNTIWPNHTTSGHQNQRLRGTGGEEAPALGDFLNFVTKMMHFRHISAKTQHKNLKVVHYYS